MPTKLNVSAVGIFLSGSTNAHPLHVLKEPEVNESSRFPGLAIATASDEPPPGSRSALAFLGCPELRP
ncbi:hypothetical protein SAMN04487785_101325 [Dyella jiangningensis]|jgi:hypothetical protein|nr:hypothetical protein BDW41_103246 [Dyella sp. AtDHG13]SDJ26132.1 hypothetical protein SAMN04487785_101325 [Dyella jiangningensis]